MQRILFLKSFPIMCILILIAACADSPTQAEIQPSPEGETQPSSQASIQVNTQTSTVTVTATRESTSTSQATLPEPTDTPEPEATATITPTPTLTFTPGPTATLSKDDWKKMPVIPTAVSDTMRAIYQLGQLMGNNPNAFSKVGDCTSVLPYFLGDLDDPEVYNLGQYDDLQSTIDYFPGSFSRESLAAKVGLSSGAALTVLWSDWKECSPTETPLDCEYRTHQPSFAIISLGTNDVTDRASMQFFEDKMRRVIDHTIGKGIVPILATKADNPEGNHFINATIARLAYE
ncbi:MAG: SGNH/GDSL hydrolase family protein [Anaerolineaceae bacterium]|nr:SGNH/GDSL hydrolase family protein [Anaerolineaceae bacterium]